MRYYMSTAKQIAALRKIGLPYSTAAKREASWKIYQAASAWYAYTRGLEALEVDGKPGPKTTADVAVALKNGGRVSPHFHLSEFRCGCKGRYHDRRTVKVDRDLLISLEKARLKVYKGPLAITSGWRCRKFNRAIGGLDNGTYVSAHCLGKAVDVRRKAGATAFLSLGFHGIGYRDHGLVTHLDIAPWVKNNYAFKE